MQVRYSVIDLEVNVPILYSLFEIPTVEFRPFEEPQEMEEIYDEEEQLWEMIEMLKERY